MTFKVGDRARLKSPIEGTIIRVRENITFPSQPDELTLQVDGHGTLLVLDSLAEHALPAGWPPQIGDVWRTQDGGEYAARKSTAAEGQILMVALDDHDPVYIYQEQLYLLEKQNPILVRRRSE